MNWLEIVGISLSAITGAGFLFLLVAVETEHEICGSAHKFGCGDTFGYEGTASGQSWLLKYGFMGKYDANGAKIVPKGINMASFGVWSPYLFFGLIGLGVILWLIGYLIAI